MSETVIKVDNISKIFRIYDRPSDRLRETFSISRRKFHSAFQALNNINFRVQRGEFLGIVGKNGAGKSTLLKILSGELTPTSGSVELNGKISLLQLGVGFDPELTGVDNARFASKLLGYTDAEIDGMLEDVIAFADIGEFIYHPVKTYSSGMYSRLSFAVGINVNPDILIADEVLSVGDMRFSQKCLRKMREFKDKGKTVIFVSHDIQSVNVFCDTAMWIKDGVVFMHGDAKYVTMCYQNHMLYDKLPDEYLAAASPIGSPEESAVPPMADAKSLTGVDPGNIEWIELAGLPCIGDGRAEIRRIALFLADTLETIRTVEGNEEIILLMDIKINSSMEGSQIGFVIYNWLGLPALHTNNDICGTPLGPLLDGQTIQPKFRFRLPAMANGNYILSLGIQTGLNMAHKIDSAYEFSISRSGIKATQCGYLIIEDETFELVGQGLGQSSQLKPTSSRNARRPW